MYRARALALALDYESARLIASNRRLHDAFSIAVLWWSWPDPAVHRLDWSDPSSLGIQSLHARAQCRVPLVSLPIPDVFPSGRLPLLAWPESGRRRVAASCE